MSATDTARKQFQFLLRYSLQSAATILILAILIRVFFISSYVMSGASMLPSVWPGDFLVAAKWSAESPRRGDVVAIRCPGSRDKTCLKRVAGVPGDRIEFLGGHLVVNGEPAFLSRVSQEITIERVAGREWTIWPASENSTPYPTAPTIVPPDHVYLLNDKRSDPEDSRRWGSRPRNEIEARVKYVWLSLDWYEGRQVRSWPRIRWPRLLRRID